MPTNARSWSLVCRGGCSGPVGQYGGEAISDVLPFGRLWYGDSNAVANAIGYAEHFSRSHDAVIRVYDEVGNVIETHEHKGDFKDCG